MAKAARSLRRRDLSEGQLDERLARSKVAPAARVETVTRLVRAGAVDDERLARNRADVLAERGAGDALVRHDLVGRGISEEDVEAALAALEPELRRAERIVSKRGSSPKTASYLARKGFSEDSIESVCGQDVAEDAPPAVR
jgi:SOS response regulatory protein OraA/RecX